MIYNVIMVGNDHTHTFLNRPEISLLKSIQFLFTQLFRLKPDFFKDKSSVQFTNVRTYIISLVNTFLLVHSHSSTLYSSRILLPLSFYTHTHLFVVDKRKWKQKRTSRASRQTFMYTILNFFFHATHSLN